MCYFMCMAVPEQVADFDKLLDNSLSIESAATTSIGQVAIAGDKNGAAYLVTINGCSCDLFRGGHKMDAQPELVISGVTSLLETVAEVRVVVHWFTDHPDRQKVTAKSTKKVTLTRFKKILPDLEEDTCYTITR